MKCRFEDRTKCPVNNRNLNRKEYSTFDISVNSQFACQICEGILRSGKLKKNKNIRIRKNSKNFKMNECKKVFPDEIRGKMINGKMGIKSVNGLSYEKVVYGRTVDMYSKRIHS